MKSGLKLLVLLLIGGAVLSVPAYADTLGLASTYNLFIFGNATVNTDVEGAVAVGGTLSGSSTIGTTASTTRTAADLIVDGGLGSGGHVNLQRGSAYVGSHHNGISFNGGTGAGYLTSDPLGSILSYQDYYEVLSQDLFSTSGEVTNGSINVSGSSCTVCTVYLSASDFAKLSSIKYNSATQTLIIDVGGNPTFSSAQHISINGSQPSDTSTAASGILFNFEQATSVTLDGAFFGSILAPEATIIGAGTDVDGTIIANSVTGLGEIHSESEFKGQLPSTPVPEPSSASMVIVGLAVFAGWRYRAHASVSQVNE